MRVLVRGHNFNYTVSRGTPLCLPGLAWREVTLNHAVPRAGGDLCMRVLVRGSMPSTTQCHVHKGVSVSWCEGSQLYSVMCAGARPPSNDTVSRGSLLVRQRHVSVCWCEGSSTIQCHVRWCEANL